MKKIIDNIYRIVLPLPNNPLRFTNTYLIKGDRSLLIDTAFNNEHCLDVLLSKLNDLNIDLNKLDVFITHLHSDHSALCQKLKEENSNIRCFISKEDGEIVNSATKNEYWITMTKMYQGFGFPINDFTKKMDTHLGWEYHMNKPVQFEYVGDSEKLHYGDYTLKTIKTPGHSPAHMCLHLESEQILFAGDHLLTDITPVIAPEFEFHNPLRHYLESLELTKDLAVSRVLVGHRNEITNIKAKSEELINHHKTRLLEIQKIHNIHGKLNAYETARYMKWDLKYDSFDDFPEIQKWFACGEAQSHIVYLENQNC